MNKKLSNPLVHLLTSAYCIYHDAEKDIVEAELPEVKKKDVEVEATEMRARPRCERNVPHLA